MRIFLHDIAAVSLGLSISGHGAGVRAGDWSLQMVESADVREDGWLSLDGLRAVEVARSTAVERHLLRPYDLLVTARSDSHQVAMVPPGVNRTVAGVTLLVIRPRDSAIGMAHWLFYYLSSASGRREIARRKLTSSSIRFLSAKDISEMEVPIPSGGELDAIVQLVELSETAYGAAVEAARLRREAIRDAMVQNIIDRADRSA